MAVAKGNWLRIIKLLAYARLLFHGHVAGQAGTHHHFYQRLLQRVDFSFAQPLVAPFYSVIGRPSLDPAVFVKLLLVHHLENIASDRKQVEVAGLHVGIRAFLGYELVHPLPSHNTVCRTRQRLPAAVFEACFAQVVGRCVQQCLVSGHPQVIDSAYIKANASTSRLRPKCSKEASHQSTP